MRCTRRLGALGLIAGGIGAGCELQEVTIAQPEPFVVVESFLEAGLSHQWVAVHGGGTIDNPLVHDARVTLSGPDGPVELIETSSSVCTTTFLDPDTLSGGFGCYETAGPVVLTAPGRAATDAFVVRPGELYRLDVVLTDGSSLTGVTRVPDALVLSPASDHEDCHLPPYSHRTLTWQPTGGASAYIVDLQAYGMAAALEEEGIDIEVPEPMLLRGLSVGSRDTTIALPRDFGMFDRFALPEATLALQRGFPEGVSMWLVIAAVDQNYANWARGGDFNPSGLIRTPSLRGSGGTGVFGSLSTAALKAHTGDDSVHLQLCGDRAPD